MTPRPTRILSKSKLRSAWNDSRDSSPSAGRPGVDNITASAFAANLDNNLSVLARRLQQGQYGPAPLKAVFIPKPNSDKERMIAVLEQRIKDKNGKEVKPVFTLPKGDLLDELIGQYIH